MSQYRKKSVVIEAVQFDGTPKGALDVFDAFDIDGAQFRPNLSDLARGVILIPTLEGDMTASGGDWIIRGVKGEFYPCKPDIFAATYEDGSAAGASETVQEARAYVEAQFHAGGFDVDGLDALIAAVRADEAEHRRIVHELREQVCRKLADTEAELDALRADTAPAISKKANSVDEKLAKKLISATPVAAGSEPECLYCENGVREYIVEGSACKTEIGFCHCPEGQARKAATQDALEARGGERDR
jgi:hypothetical protein